MMISQKRVCWSGVAIAAWLGASPVFGHAKLLVSVPAADALLTEPPPSITLTFSEAVRLAVFRLSSNGREVAVELDRSAPPARSVTVPLPPMAAGKYDVQWGVLTVTDGHAVKGTYSFVIR